MRTRGRSIARFALARSSTAITPRTVTRRAQHPLNVFSFANSRYTLRNRTVLRIEVLMLGSLEVRRDGAPLALGRRRQRALLALLACEPNRVVSVERIV